MGSGDDFESLYRSYHKRLIRYFMRAFHLTEDQAEDLAHDTFVRVWRAIEAYRGDACWAFLETTAHRVGLNRVRSKNTGKRYGREETIDEGAHNLAAPDQDQVERMDRAMQSRQLRDAIEKLPSVQREYLRLQQDGFSYQEIATLYKTTEDAVKSRLRDARINLKKLLPGGEE
jgi:RNA polymerase sigma-70 factor (ECF subfamily)